MKTNLALLKKFIVLLLMMVSASSFAQFRVIGYLPTWGGNLSDVQYTKLTHINYAFLIPNSDGTYQAPDDPARLKNLVTQAHANGVKVIISVGGGGGGDAFRTIVPNASYRTTFVNNMVSFANQYNLDGVDIDWEFPSDGTEANNFLLLMQQLSTAMHVNGKLCTAAVIAYGGTSFVNGIFSVVDFLNIMAYDENSYDHSTYDLAVKSVNYWEGRGLPASKTVLGVPFYGRDKCCSYKTVDYSAILAMGGSPNADTYNNQIGYNGIPTMKQKTAYAMQACGGIMIWSIDTDVIGQYSLLSAINQVVVANSNPVPDNLAKGKAVTASSTEVSTTTSTVASNVTDGSYSTRWSSLFADPQWVSVDLGANYNVNRVKVSWEAAYATAYQIQISSDGINWSTLKSVIGNATTTNDQTGLSGSGRYVRIYGTARATVYGYSLYEIEVYGNAIESPYSGTAITLPGTIQTENYDLGGEGIAYHDIDVANQNGVYRTDGVDIEATTDVGGGYDVGWTAAGEWLKYTVNVTASGTYNIGFRTAATSTAGVISLQVDGNTFAGPVSLPNTGAWQTWATTTVSNIALTAGQHVITLQIVTGGFNLNYVTVTAPLVNIAPTVSITSPVNNASFNAPATITITANAADVDGTVSKVDFYNGTKLLGTTTVAPYSFVWSNITAGTYSISAKATDNSAAVTTSASVNATVVIVVESAFGGTAMVLPGQLEAESYDLGGEGIAYHDIDVANQGGVYRTDGVDVQATTDIGGGYNVGYTANGEWLKYTVNITASGNYNIGFRTAATSSAGIISLQVDGNTVAGPVSLPNTGAWQTWATTTVSNIALTAGQHVITLQIVTGGFNLNYVTVAVPSTVINPGYLHASGKNIVNDKGNFVIKAINIGDYMIQEGYTMNLGGSQHIYRDKIATMVGTAARDQFYTNYYQNFITKADIDSIAKWGFNAIRLPMHYELFTPLGQPTVFLDQGFTIVDNILGWAKANNIYVILDLHAAPGGENSGDISDYDSSQPSLWESAANRSQTVALWAKLASRYANEQYIGGYDLINETNWTLANNNALLAQLMKDITTAIRQVDNNHIVYIEGNSYANDYNGLTPKWDNNMVYSFHKYWNDDSQASLNFVLSIRDGQNVPIWMGEFGENSNNWIANAVTLMNQNNIGWAIWPYKKMSSVSSVSSFQQPSNWSVFADYVNGGAQPSSATGQAILNELLEDIKVSNCKVNKGYLYALFNQPGNTNTVPFTAVSSLPGRLTASNYDEGLEGYAYNDAAYQNTQYGSTVGSSTNWNQGWYYRNDGVDLQYSTAENAPTIGWTENGDWMQYTVNITTTGSYAVKVRVAGNGGTLSLSSDGTTLINSAAIASTGGWDTWQTFTLGNVNLTAGAHKLRFTINTAGYNLSYFDFSTQAVVINQAPSVSITSPTSATSFTAPASITINATASDVDGTVSKVDFYYGITLLGTDNTSPYSFVWSNAVAGNYSVTAKATDNSGAVTTSASVSVTVKNVTTTNTCSGVAQYVENNGYVAGSKVQSGGVIYQCKPYPYTGWCNGAAWAYGPGTGTAWTDAWIQMGTCSNVRVGAMNSISSTNTAVTTNLLVPNPTTGIFTISVVSSAAVQVLNSYGEEVLAVNEVAANGSIDITALSAGVYFVKIISGEGNLTIQKIVKQ